MARINYVELPASDIAASREFYATAFGFDLTAFGPSYAATMTGDVDLGLQGDLTEASAAPLAVIDVDDLDAALAAVVAAGGTIVRPTFAFPGGRRFHFADPHGNELAVVRADAAATIVPQGFATVAPYLMVADADAYVDFLVAAFDGIHMGTSRRPDGTIANAQILFGAGPAAATIMVGEVRSGDPACRVDLMLYVPDATAALARAVAAGAVEVMAVGDMPYGDRQAGVRDRWGTTWWLSQRLTHAAYSFE